MKNNLAALACAAAVLAPISVLATPAFALSTSDSGAVVQSEGSETELEPGDDQGQAPVAGDDDQGEVEAPSDEAGDDDAGEDEDEAEDEDGDDAPKVKQNKTPQLKWVKKVAVRGDKATVMVKYRCWGNEDGLVWISLAQGGALRGKKETQIDKISDVAAAAAVVYDTAATRALENADCDGHWHVDKYKLASQKGTLRSGKVYLEATVTDGLVAAPASVDSDDLIKVKVAKVKVSKKGKGKSGR